MNLPNQRGRVELLLDYYLGAYGPTIRIDIVLLKSLKKLKMLFIKLAKGEMHEVKFHEMKSVKITGMNEFILKSMPNIKYGEKTLHLRSDNRGKITFYWSNSSLGWEVCAELLDALIKYRGPAHQYLTQEGKDDAIVEVAFKESKNAFGERAFLDPQRSSQLIQRHQRRNRHTAA